MSEDKQSRGSAHAICVAGKVLDRVEAAASLVGAAAIVAILAIVFADVVMRYAFNAPLRWSYDLVSRYLLLAAFYSLASATLRHEAHIRVLFFRPFVPGRVKAVMDTATSAVTAAVFAWIAAVAARRGHGEFVNDERFVGAILWPTWITSAFVAAGAALLALRLALMPLRRGADVATGRPDPALDEGIPGARS